MRPDHVSFWEWHRGKFIVLGVVVAGVALGFAVWKALRGTETVNPKPFNATAAKIRRTEAKLEKKRERSLPVQTLLPPASEGNNGTPHPKTSHTGGAVLSSHATSAFEALESELSAQIGVSVAPLGSGEPEQIGGLETGHAWSSFKVPIVVTALREQGSLSESQKSEANAAITASDNEAAAALFSSLGSSASAAVENTLAASGYPTQVATAPPPPGAVSSWGQTDWPLSSSVGFYRALACEALEISPADTAYVIGLMESVISEQQWGLGEAGIDGQVAIKAGWGPDGSESGPYLVRQAGILRSNDGTTGAVVTIAAQDDSGSFDAGVQDLDAVAAWVKENVSLTAGSCAG
ncbi:MAG: hypothetical protein H0X42_01305 [Solirubrobacterales bacterium]|nr:hypothetical protein [Solirubrobacterales bacterium]